MVSLRGQKRLSYTQIGLSLGFNTIFPTSIPTPFTWKSPGGVGGENRWSKLCCFFIAPFEPTEETGGTTTRGPDTTSATRKKTKGKTIGGLAILGFCLVALLVVLVTAFAIYYVAFRKRMYPEYWAELEPDVPPPGPAVAAAEVAAAAAPAAGAKKKVPEVGIAHEGFVAESPSPTDEAPPGYFEKNMEETKDETKEDGGGAENVENKQEKRVENVENKQEEGVENVGFSEESAL